MKPTTDEHDFNFKVKNALRFLKDGDKVKVSIRFSGRQLNYTTLGKEALDKFALAVEEAGAVEKKPKLEGRSMVMVINPK